MADWIGLLLLADPLDGAKGKSLLSAPSKSLLLPAFNPPHNAISTSAWLEPSPSEMADETPLPSAGITSAMCGPSSADLPLSLHPSRLVGFN